MSRTTTRRKWPRVPANTHLSRLRLPSATAMEGGRRFARLAGEPASAQGPRRQGGPGATHKALAQRRRRHAHTVSPAVVCPISPHAREAHSHSHSTRRAAARFASPARPSARSLLHGQRQADDGPSVGAPGSVVWTDKVRRGRRRRRRRRWTIDLIHQNQTIVAD